MVDLSYLVAFAPSLLISSMRSEDDGYDRINYKYTVALLVLFAIITATQQFDDNRIECWNRANFKKPYIEYTNQICYISSTYRVDKNTTIPNSIQEREDSRLNYYQWVPFILLLMALFFHLPRLIWRSLSVRSGIDLLDIVEAVDNTKTVENFDKRDQLIKYIVDTIDMYVDDARRQTYSENRQRSLLTSLCQLVCCTTGKFLGNYFITLYMFIKVYYILNVVLQIWLLNMFLGINFLQFGFERVKLFRYGLNQPESKYFPRETFCDFHVREPLHGGQPLQRITVQCILTVNLFNQQIFTFLWIWFIAVFFFNIYSLIIWSVRLGSFKRRYHFIFTRLGRISREEIPRFRFDFKHSKREVGDYVHKELVKCFVENYLEPDGFFFIRMLTVIVSGFIVQELIEKLWATYIMKYGEHDAKRAEISFYEFRQQPRHSISMGASQANLLNVVDEYCGANDAKRQFLRRNSELLTGLMPSTNAKQPITSSTQKQNQQV